jgi:putative ABC transport system ATP-binding protein
MLTVDNLEKTYHSKHGAVNALSNISLTIEPGSFVTITGASGSGKTTLLLALGGLIHPTSGSILYNGENLYSMPESRISEYRNKQVGFILQTFNLIPYLTAHQNVMLPMLFDAEKNGDAPLKADVLLKKVGLAHRKEHLPRELSVGQQQRVAIARSLANNPKIILADEPTGNLDPNLSREILQILKDLNETEWRTIVMVTHSPEAADFGTERLILNEGILVN